MPSLLEVEIHIALLAALTGAVFSVWVMVWYVRDKKKVDRSRRQIDKGLRSMNALGAQMVAALQTSDPAVVQKALDSVSEFKELVVALPDHIYAKVRGSYGAAMKKEYRDKAAIAKSIDDAIDGEILDAYSATPDSRWKKALVNAGLQHPELADFARDYAAGRVAAATGAPTPEKVASGHPLDT